MASQVRPDAGQAIENVARAAQAVMVASGALLLLLGSFIWAGHADQLIPIHVLIGIVLVVALWTIAAIAARSGVSNLIVAAAVAWSIVASILGTTQEALLVGNWHWTIQVLHVIVAMGVVGWGRALMVLARRARGRNSDGG